MARAKVHATLTSHHEPQRADSLLAEARDLAQRHGDPAAEARILWNLMVLRTWGGEDFHQAVAFGEEAAEIARKVGATETLAFALNDLVYPLVASLDYSAARTACHEARRLWRQLENLPMLVDSLSSGVLLDYAFGSFDEGEAHAAEAKRISQQIDNIWGQTNSRLYLGQIERDRGRIAAALDTFETAIALGDRSRHPGALIASRVDLALLLGDLGDPERARELLDQAEALAVPVADMAAGLPSRGAGTPRSAPGSVGCGRTGRRRGSPKAPPPGAPMVCAGLPGSGGSRDRPGPRPPDPGGGHPDRPGAPPGGNARTSVPPRNSSSPGARLVGHRTAPGGGCGGRSGLRRGSPDRLPLDLVAGAARPVGSASALRRPGRCCERQSRSPIPSRPARPSTPRRGSARFVPRAPRRPCRHRRLKRSFAGHVARAAGL